MRWQLDQTVPTLWARAEDEEEKQQSEYYESKKALEAARFDSATGIQDTALIDAKWLMKLKARVPPCRQQLPKRAIFQGSVDDEDVVVLAISCPWLTRQHPDPEGWHLKIILHFLRLFFNLKNKEEEVRADNRHRIVTRPPTGKGKRVAIFWDWLSLYQKHSPGGRTRPQGESFMRAFRDSNIWFANRQTMVWRQTKLPEGHHIGHDIDPYPKRGWCFFEMALAEMFTPCDRVLDLGLERISSGALRHVASLTLLRLASLR